MTVSFEIPASLQQQMMQVGEDPSAAVKEAALVEFYRQKRIDHSQLAAAIGTSRDGADAVLKRHDVLLEITADDVEDEVRELRRLLRP